MSANWTREVSWTEGDEYLTVTCPQGGGNPPNAPGRGKRKKEDTATSIVVYPDDRNGDGARIRYQSIGAGTLDIRGKHTPPPAGFEVHRHPKGAVTLIDRGETDEDWSYYICSDVDGGKQSEDPMVHNIA